MMQQEISAIGIDLGSHKSVIALARDTIVEVQLNDGSSRETPNVIGFKDNERFIGEQGFQQMGTNFMNTIKYFTRFLAGQTHPEFNAVERKHIFGKTIEMDGKTIFEVEYEGKPTIFRAEQLTASHISELVKKYNQPIYISYPDYYTEQDKFCLLESCDIGQINIQGFLSESESIMYDYGFHRREEFNPQRTVLFVDIGQCNFNAFVADFTKNTAYKIAQVFDRNCGGRDLDMIVLDHFWIQIKDQIADLQELQIQKTRMRLLSALEKLRLNLSSNSEGQLNVECLTRDFDLVEKVERTDYEKIISPFIMKLKTLLLELKNKTTYANINSIEILGGISRIPSIQLAIQSIFPQAKLSKTLNATESISRGCALHGVLTKSIDNQYKTDDLIHYPVKVGLVINNQIKNFLNIEKCEEDLTEFFPKQQCFQLYDLNEFSRGRKNIEIDTHSFETLEFTLFYEPRIKGYHSALKQYRVLCPEEKATFDLVKVTFGQDQYQLINMLSASAFYKNEFVVQLGYFIEYLEEDSPKQIQSLVQKEYLMKRKDSIIRNFHQVKYNLESLIYKTRDDLSSFFTVLDPSEKAEVNEKLIAMEQWLYNDDFEKTEEICTQQMERLNMVLQPYYRQQNKTMFK